MNKNLLLLLYFIELTVFITCEYLKALCHHHLNEKPRNSIKETRTFVIVTMHML